MTKRYTRYDPQFPFTLSLQMANKALEIPSITLRNGVELPAISLGTAHVILEENTKDNFRGFKPERTYRQIQLALENGIRAFDCGRIYRANRHVGLVLAEWFRTGKIEREDVFLTTKVFHGSAEPVATRSSHMFNMEDLTPDQVTEEVQKEVEEALDDLGVGQIDLLLLHWPSSGKGGTLGGKSDENESEQERKMKARQRRLAAWRVLEDMYKRGWARAIGVSNFSEYHLNDLHMDGASIMPMVNQIEASLSVMYLDIVEYCTTHGIVCQAFSPLKRGYLLPESNDRMAEIAQKYKKSEAQIALRFLFDNKFAITVLSTNETRMIDNHNIFDFQLTEMEIQLLYDLPTATGNWGLPTPYELD